MNEEVFERLLKKLDSRINNDGVDTSVSPTLGSGCDNSRPVPLFITTDIDFESLSANELTLAHVLLHKFYAQKTNREFTKKELKELHKRLVVHLNNHQYYDGLDESGTNR